MILCENLPCLTGKSLAHPVVLAVNTGSERLMLCEMLFLSTVASFCRKRADCMLYLMYLKYIAYSTHRLDPLFVFLQFILLAF